MRRYALLAFLSGMSVAANLLGYWLAGRLFNSAGAGIFAVAKRLSAITCSVFGLGIYPAIAAASALDSGKTNWQPKVPVIVSQSFQMIGVIAILSVILAIVLPSQILRQTFGDGSYIRELLFLSILWGIGLAGLSIVGHEWIGRGRIAFAYLLWIVGVGLLPCVFMGVGFIFKLGIMPTLWVNAVVVLVLALYLSVRITAKGGRGLSWSFVFSVIPRVFGDFGNQAMLTLPCLAVADRGESYVTAAAFSSALLAVVSVGTAPAAAMLVKPLADGRWQFSTSTNKIIFTVSLAVIGIGIYVSFFIALKVGDVERLWEILALDGTAMRDVLPYVGAGALPYAACIIMRTALESAYSFPVYGTTMTISALLLCGFAVIYGQGSGLSNYLFPMGFSLIFMFLLAAFLSRPMSIIQSRMEGA